MSKGRGDEANASSDNKKLQAKFSTIDNAPFSFFLLFLSLSSSSSASIKLAINVNKTVKVFA